MEPESLYRKNCDLELYLLRSLSLVQQQGTLHPPMLLFSTLAHLAGLLDVMDALYEAKFPQVQASEKLMAFGWLDMLHGQAREALPYASSVLSSISALTIVNAAWASSDLMDEIRTRFQRILIRSLKKLLDSPAMLELHDSTRLVDVAPVFAAMVPSVNWLGLAVTATQASSPFSDLNFDHDDLARLRKVLKSLATLYGTVSNQSALLEYLATHVTLVDCSDRYVEESRTVTLAHSIVDSALVNLMLM